MFTGRPTRDAIVLSDNRVIKLLLQHFLLDQKDYGVALQKLRDAKVATDKTLGCDGNTYYECPMDRMRLIGEHVETFYNSLHLRMKQYEDSLEKESSTHVDAHGVLVEPFERDSKYPVPLGIRDYYIRLEAKRKEEEERLALEKTLAAEKAAQKAERNALFFGFRPTTAPASTSASVTPSRPASGGAVRQSVNGMGGGNKTPAPAPPLGKQQSMIKQGISNLNTSNNGKPGGVTINLSANQVCVYAEKFKLFYVSKTFSCICVPLLNMD
ncbi:hypothetical protein EON65_33655 [archaeon]|nr:MAG: hypothetical protein EON65_33655 [archaeon]